MKIKRSTLSHIWIKIYTKRALQLEKFWIIPNISEGDEENLEEQKDLGGEKEVDGDQIEKEQSSQNLL